MNNTSFRFCTFIGTPDEQAAVAQKHGYQIVRLKSVPFMAAFKAESDKRIHAILWRGNRSEPIIAGLFSSMRALESNVTYYVNLWKRSNECKQARKAERAEKQAKLRAADHWAVGDVVSNSWGYEQTNIDFYEVVEVKSKTITLRPIRRNSKPTEWMQGVCQPRRGDYVGEDRITKRVSPEGYISMKHGAACKWDGRALHWTAYH